MGEFFASGTTLPEAYHNALMILKDYGEITESSDWNTRCLECSMTLEITNPLQEPMISKCFIGSPESLQQYKMEMLDGILDFEIARGNWTYTYHDRIFNYDGVDQIQFVIDELKRNPDSRRAVVLIRNKADIGSDDPACLNHINYFIRNGRLDCKVLFRSNDATRANFMNMFALIMLQKKIADALGVEVGTYVHRANSYHCYETEWKYLENYVERIKKNPKGCCAEYEDDWKEMMEEEIPNIMRKVEELKRH